MSEWSDHLVARTAEFVLTSLGSAHYARVYRSLKASQVLNSATELAAPAAVEAQTSERLAIVGAPAYSQRHWPVTGLKLLVPQYCPTRLVLAQCKA